MKLTLEQFKSAYPELHADIDSQAFQRGLDEGKETGRSEGFEAGKSAERARIQEVERVSIPGHEKLIAELKYDGRTSGPEAAVKVLEAEKALRETKQASFVADGPAPVKPAPAPENESLEAQEAGLPVEERCRKRWDRDANIREEFKMGGLASYTAFERNKENVRILEKKKDD